MWNLLKKRREKESMIIYDLIENDLDFFYDMVRFPELIDGDLNDVVIGNLPRVKFSVYGMLKNNMCVCFLFGYVKTAMVQLAYDKKLAVVYSKDVWAFNDSEYIMELKDNNEFTIGHFIEFYNKQLLHSNGLFFTGLNYKDHELVSCRQINHKKGEEKTSSIF